MLGTAPDFVVEPYLVAAEYEQLCSVLVHRPGAEIDCVSDPKQVLWQDKVDSSRARDQHDELTEFYRACGITVHTMRPEIESTTPNLYFCRDLFAVTSNGVVLARPSSSVRRGEEVSAAKVLEALGVRPIHHIKNGGTFEGGDLLIVNSDLALVGVGNRTNVSGAAQLRRLLKFAGVERVGSFLLHPSSLHLDMCVAIIDRNLAAVNAEQVPVGVVDLLEYHGFKVLILPEDEAVQGMAVNFVTLAPRTVVMTSGNPKTRGVLSRAGVECFEVDVSELMKGGGGIHCMTGVLERDLSGWI